MLLQRLSLLFTMEATIVESLDQTPFARRLDVMIFSLLSPIQQ